MLGSLATIFVSLLKDGQPEYYGDRVQETCIACGKEHDKVWRIKRRTASWGHFATADINGASVVIDASLPTEVKKVPRGAVALTPEEAARVWHEDNESHVFGGPNVAKALRESIAEANAR